MILFMNTIRMKNGTGDVLAKRFQNPKGVQSFPGFVRMEVLKTEGTEDYEEFKVCTTWESKGDFDKWVHSDAFKQSHAKNRELNSDILGNQLTMHEIVVSRDPDPNVRKHVEQPL
ncbi:antibiotic biosynthesis monooxygenase [Paenibacillus larvae]|uniref:Antibiotic biosynthesis monooxygenase n=2 Tax=Paenibacillus larvae TaxID=1464 RepID=V9W8P9_9BACL|nr:antibiotic biosynthesis monooxygenase [Paenibacillus larvae]AHD07411.1 antibiotic biosynthesis monooxygenase [Paenibacillus larvae subsp. larvae DSM 25430]AVG13975.1 antibiotic biosynthesis monooxygenase [Paenibacillus larvae subsp. larvae DSM 25430]MDR5597643.1 antibiotic biosynthesis monooxygenase [Paenibacillus larvae]